jgi:hypothetical protein
MHKPKIMPAIMSADDPRKAPEPAPSGGGGRQPPEVTLAEPDDEPEPLRLNYGGR